MAAHFFQPCDGLSIMWGESLAHAPRASPLALVAARRRPSVFDRRSFSGAPRLAAVRLADWRVQVCSHVPASATNTCLKPHLNAPPPLGSRFGCAAKVIGGAGGLLLVSARPTIGCAMLHGRRPWLLLAVDIKQLALAARFSW